MKSCFFIQIVLTILSASLVHADPPSTHGMLLFGQSMTYASHLPMFHAPHDYQAIFKLSLSDSNSEQTVAAYTKAKAQHHGIFTLVPEKMDLTKVLNGSKTQFQAEIYLGHFERGGTSIGPVTVQVEAVIFSKKLQPNEKDVDLEYVAFGESGEMYAAHLIKGKPSFDAVVQLTPLVGEAQTLSVILNAGTNSQRLPVVGDTLITPSKSQIQIKNILYLEQAELAH